MGSQTGVTSVGHGEKDRKMVTTNGVEDSHCNASKEVGRGQDYIRSGIRFRAGVLREGEEITLQGGEEPMPPPELGGGTTMDVEVGGNHVGGEGAVNVGEEVKRDGGCGTDINGGTGNGKAREEEAKDEVFSGVRKEGLEPNRELAKVANGYSATRYWVGIVGAVEEVGRCTDST